MKLLHCYLCESKGCDIIRTKIRHDIVRNVLCCKECGLVFLEPGASDLQDYYKADYRVAHTPVIGQKLSSEEIFLTYLPMQKLRIEKIRNFLRNDARLLDIGCSAGHFLKAVFTLVGECNGLEFNIQDAEFIRTKLGFRVWTEPIERTDCPKEYFDMITVFQTLEHIADPVSFLKTVALYLKPKGYLVLEVPNIKDALLSVYGLESYADFYYREPHLFYYSPSTLKRLVEKCGFSGEISTIQRYNVLNHLSWIFTKMPQSSASIAMGASNLPITAFDSNKDVHQALDQWVKKADSEYREILNRFGIGESVFFIGQKK